MKFYVTVDWKYGVGTYVMQSRKMSLKLKIKIFGF